MNLYHTSADPLLPQLGRLLNVGDEFMSVPSVFTQAVPLVSVIAPEQSSFATGVI